MTEEENGQNSLFWKRFFIEDLVSTGRKSIGPEEIE